MKPLYTQEEFDSAKSRQLLPFECEQCGKTFHKPKNQVQAVIKGTDSMRIRFCGHRCKDENNTIKIECVCKHCGNTFIRKPSDLKDSKNYFCSKSCSGTYNNTHKTKGTRFSKLERWLSVELPYKFPSLVFHFNRKDAINSELDIYIPSLNLAFELNGIFHYEPIFGEEKLKSIKNNDDRKFQACIENGIELCIIDTSKHKYFKESTCIPFLNIICDIIKKKAKNTVKLAKSKPKYVQLELF